MVSQVELMEEPNILEQISEEEYKPQISSEEEGILVEGEGGQPPIAYDELQELFESEHVINAVAAEDDWLDNFLDAFEEIDKQKVDAI